MQNKNAKALSVLMALLVFPEPSTAAARKPLRPSNYPKTSETAALHPGQPNRKPKRGGLRMLLAGKLRPEKKSKKQKKGAKPGAAQVAHAPQKHPGKKPKQGAQTHAQAAQYAEAPAPAARQKNAPVARNIEIMPVAGAAPTSKQVEHVATIELARKDAHVARLASSPAAPLPKLQVLDEMKTSASAPTQTAQQAEAPIEVAQEASVVTIPGWRGGYHDAKAGEDVTAISRRYGVTRDAILRYNRVPDSGPVPEGRTLFIPPATGTYALSPNAPMSPASPAHVRPVVAKFQPAPVPMKAPAPAQVAAKAKTAADDEEDDNEPGPWDKIKTTVSGVFDGFKRLIDRPGRDGKGAQPAARSGYAIPPLETANAKPHAGTATAMATKFEWPISGQIISGFGPRHGVPHNGVDISASRGTPIHAAAAGKVIFASTMRGYGNVIILDHGNRYFTVYAHNQENLVGKADEAHPIDVKAGQTIALVGDSGNAQAPHLHFEVRFENKATDPMPFLPGGTQAQPQATRPSDDSEEDSRG